MLAENVILAEWEVGTVVNCCKSKGEKPKCYYSAWSIMLENTNRMPRKVAFRWWYLVLVKESLEDLKVEFWACEGALELQEMRVNIKKTKMTIGSVEAKEGKLSCTVSLNMQVLIPSSASLASLGYVRDVLVVDVNWSRMISLNVGHT